MLRKRKMESGLWVIFVSVVVASGGDVRLVNGPSRCAGRVEVFHDEQWGTVCDDYWNMHVAAVVCRELGCGEAVEALHRAHFGPGSGPIWMDGLSCEGSESSLKTCTFRGWGQHDCSHVEDAGVLCSADRKPRLSDGPHLCSGRVEVLRGKTWGSVCDAAFDLQDAEVVCRELGCGIPVELLGAAAFGWGQEQIWSEDMQCGGNETEISFCPTSSTQKHICSHENDVGLVCAGYTDARLVNGSDRCSGRVELQFLTDWGTVCDASWDIKAASVLCGQLHCGIAVALVGADWFGQGSGHIWADVFECRGNETHLSRCSISSWSRAACSHRQDVGLICSGSSLSVHDGMVRLSGGGGCEGEVEVYLHQVWRRVLLDSWSLSDSSVVCRQLQCGSAVKFYASSRNRTERRAVCVSGFQCSGTEAHLGNCSSPQILNCSSRQQVTITCSGPRKLRLVGSGHDCAGRLEVFHNGSWGTVCDDSWDPEDAQVVCSQLRCGTALSVQLNISFGPGNGPIWLNEVACHGNETSLWQCPSAGWGQHDCRHKEDVGVVCSEFKQLRISGSESGLCSGPVQVFYNGTWGSMCVNHMGEYTASIICRQLGCGDIISTDSGISHLPKWLDNVICGKHDSHIWQCAASPWGNNSCSVTEALHVTCSESKPTKPWFDVLSLNADVTAQQCSGPPELRLVGPTECSGRVEVRLQGQWGTVCDDSWDTRDGQVVCRQLGCGEPVSVGGEGMFGGGNGSIWLDEVNCGGDERHLWDCCHAPLNQSDCSHKEDAGVTCTGRSTTVLLIPTSASITAPPPAPASTISSVATPVLGTLVLLLLGLLLYQKRSTRRALSKRKHIPLTEGLYEEIDHRWIKGTSRSIRSGRVPSDASWYEDVEDNKHGLFSQSVREEGLEGYDDAFTGETPEEYDDVITDKNLNKLPEMVTVEPPQDYDNDDVINMGHDLIDLIEGMENEDPPEYDDVISAEKNSGSLTGPSGLDYDDVGVGPQEKEAV
ncbi:scavenger receptor cysteine-rich type 1 protein M130-like isoform X2 [Denticeps clupeoides]|uniref:scavenger receptor cysteine-rich type 1 protein M130-like isoform X2 n=1 Tax=Denticeps clupeoides TaxID=299321 RepID=UPI0010A55451|nr:scavenger receptor cysteine-rich type 1 protein M130-like isoform X2 [Denticeps clupeoides]